MSILSRRSLMQVGIAGASVGLLSGCKVLEAGASVAMQVGGLSSGQAESVIRGTKAIAKTFEDFTPEQEYYIGRTVSANIFQKFHTYYDYEKLTYLNLVGLSLAQASAKPETFGGYHFAILKSDEVNAFAAPGGFIFVTQGMLRCCPHEDALAAVLAHEIAHVQLKHGLQAIKASRVTDAITILAGEAASHAGGAQLKQLVNTFEGSISDITSTMINSGYSRSYEKEADDLAITIMDQAGYSKKGMGDMLNLMKQRLHSGGNDFFKTHPSPAERLQLVNDKLIGAPIVPRFRQERLKQQLGQA